MIGALQPYFGCKREQAKGLNEAFGDHQVWWDLTAGSFAPLFGKKPCRVEVVNDLNGAVINLARVVQNDILAVRLYEKLNRTFFCEELFEDSRQWLLANTQRLREMLGIDALAGDDMLAWAYHIFTFSWQARNGMAGTKKELGLGFCKRFTSNGGDGAVRFRNAVESVPEWNARLHGVTILCEDAIKLASKIEDKEGTVIYADCPYFEKSTEYLHDFTEEQHRQLAEALRRFTKTRVVVSYYMHDLIKPLYLDHGFRLIEKTTVKKVSAGERTKAPEVLLVNHAA